jgi:carbamoyl-phosphate synthase large subunit
VIDICGNKVNTHRWLTEHRFPTMRQASPEEVLDAPQDWEFPLVAKPIGGSSSIGLYYVKDADDLAALMKREDPARYIVQSMATGDEFTVDVVVNREGRCLCAIPRQRIEVRAGEISKGKTVRNPKVQQLAIDIAQTLPGSYGVMNIQIFYDADKDALNVIEINPRFGGGFPLSYAAGGDYPRWLLEELFDLPSTYEGPDLWKDGLVMLRYDAAVFLDQSEL